MPRINALTSDTAPVASDYVAVDGSNGTRRVLLSDFGVAAHGAYTAMNHRNIYRGKSLGTSITAAQMSYVSSGKFTDMYVGDYWTIGNIIWRIWDMDYWYLIGDTSFAPHHLVIMPDSNLYTAQMNSSNTTEGGYVGSEMYTTNLADARSTIQSVFGDYLLTHREYLTNAVTDGHPSAGAWYDSDVDLINEEMLYGCPIRQAMNDGSAVATTTTVCKRQLALAALNPQVANKRISFWLRDVVSASFFANANYIGLAVSNYASNSFGVRPAFAVGVAA